MAFTVTSNSFKDGDYLAKDFILSADFGFGCAGGNTSPHLKWSGAPAGTKSFAITCYDPDAPTGSGFWHWLILNIPSTVTELEAGAGSAGGKMPAGALQTRTDFGASGYGGPCPPEGDHPHRYLFTVFAVKADKIDVKADTSAAVVGFNLPKPRSWACSSGEGAGLFRAGLVAELVDHLAARDGVECQCVHVVVRHKVLAQFWFIGRQHVVGRFRRDVALAIMPGVKQQLRARLDAHIPDAEKQRAG